VQPQLNGLRVHAAPLPRPSQDAGLEGKPPQAREDPIYLHWLCVRPDRLNSYGRPLCKVPPVADFVPSYADPKPPASLFPTTELGVGPWPGAFATPAGAGQSILSPPGRTARAERAAAPAVRRRAGRRESRRRHGIALPADGFASFLSASTGHAGRASQGSAGRHGW
jgi:hypothetical protein